MLDWNGNCEDACSEMDGMATMHEPEFTDAQRRSQRCKLTEAPSRYTTLQKDQPGKNEQTLRSSEDSVDSTERYEQSPHSNRCKA